MKNLNSKEKNPPNRRYTSYFDPTEFEIKGTKKFIYVLLAIGIGVSVLMIICFFEIVIFISNSLSRI